MSTHEYQWDPDDERPPPDEDAEAAADLHGYLEHMTRHYSVHHGRILTPRQEFSGILQYAACAIDRLAQHEAAGDAADHRGSLLQALGGLYRLLAHYAPGPLPWPDRPPGEEDPR